MGLCSQNPAHKLLHCIKLFDIFFFQLIIHIYISTDLGLLFEVYLYTSHTLKKTTKKNKKIKK